MPRKTRSTRKKATGGLSKSSVQKLAAIAENTEQDDFANLIDDFDIQADKLKRQTKRLFDNETKKLMQFLPQKSSIPKAILKMSAYEFKERGGTLGAVLESYKRDKQGEQECHPVESTAVPSANPTVVDKENKTESVAINPDFVTPAINTRSKALTGEALFTEKRKPRPLEQVALSVSATNSGSPVDEQVFMKLKLGQAVEDIESQLLAATSAFPQKWRSQLQKHLKNARLQVSSQMEGQCFQTPALPR